MSALGKSSFQTEGRDRKEKKKAEKKEKRVEPPSDIQRPPYLLTYSAGPSSLPQRLNNTLPPSSPQIPPLTSPKHALNSSVPLTSPQCLTNQSSTSSCSSSYIELASKKAIAFERLRLLRIWSRARAWRWFREYREAMW